MISRVLCLVALTRLVLGDVCPRRRLDAEDKNVVASAFPQAQKEDIEIVFSKAVNDLVNADLCYEITNKFNDDFKADFVDAKFKDSEFKDSKFADIAAGISEWCGEMALKRRRTFASHDEDGWKFYEDEVLEALKRADPADKSSIRRRQGTEGTLPASTYYQCAGYAKLLSLALKGTQPGKADKAAETFGDSANSGTEERLGGCGVVVRTVNDILDTEELEGVELKETSGGKEEVFLDAVVVKSGSARRLGEQLLVTTGLLASGALSRALMHICHYYNDVGMLPPVM